MLSFAAGVGQRNNVPPCSSHPCLFLRVASSFKWEEIARRLLRALTLCASRFTVSSKLTSEGSHLHLHWEKVHSPETVVRVRGQCCRPRSPKHSHCASSETSKVKTRSSIHVTNAAKLQYTAAKSFDKLARSLWERRRFAGSASIWAWQILFSQCFQANPRGGGGVSIAAFL